MNLIAKEDLRMITKGMAYSAKVKPVTRDGVLHHFIIGVAADDGWFNYYTTEDVAKYFLVVEEFTSYNVE